MEYPTYYKNIKRILSYIKNQYINKISLFLLKKKVFKLCYIFIF